MRLQNGQKRHADLLDKQELIEQVLREFDARTPASDRAVPLDVRSILTHIHQHLFSPDLNVAAVRRACRLRNNNVSTRFRYVLGVGVRDYIENMRMAAATRLLRHHHLEVYLVAMSVGYDHQETFCRAFRRQFGCTPSEWRASRGATSRASLPSFQRAPRSGAELGRFSPRNFS